MDALHVGCVSATAENYRGLFSCLVNWLKVVDVELHENKLNQK